MGNQCACFDAPVGTLPTESFAKEYEIHSVAPDDKVLVPSNAEKGKVSEMLHEMSTTASGEACMALTFRIPDTGNRVSVDFTYRPLGLDLSKRTPMRVRAVEVNSCGARGGVQAGWVLLKVNDDDVSDKDFAYTVDRLKEETRQLRVAGELPKKSSKSRGGSRGSSRAPSRLGTLWEVEECALETQLESSL